MIPYADIKFENIAGFFDEYDLTTEELDFLREKFAEDEGQDAIDIFVENHILPASVKYQDVISYYLNSSLAGPLTDEDIDKVSRNTSLLTLGIISLFVSNFNKFTKVYAKDVFRQARLTNVEIKNAIIDETLSEFERLITGTLQNTQTFILSSIRTIQREMIAENVILNKSGLKGIELENAISKFRSDLKNKYPLVYKAALEGNIIATSKIIENKEYARHYKFSHYADMSVRTTLLNVDRNANEIIARVNDEPVMEYVLADPRTVKKERVICQHILEIKTNGKSLLALDEITAKKLGIMTIQEAQSTPDFAMGVYCRHTVRRVSRDFVKELNL